MTAPFPGSFADKLPPEGHAVEGQQDEHHHTEQKQGQQHAALIQKRFKPVPGDVVFPDIEEEGRQKVKPEEKGSKQDMNQAMAPACPFRTASCRKKSAFNSNRPMVRTQSAP